MWLRTVFCAIIALTLIARSDVAKGDPIQDTFSVSNDATFGPIQATLDELIAKNSKTSTNHVCVIGQQLTIIADKRGSIGVKDTHSSFGSLPVRASAILHCLDAICDWSKTRYRRTMNVSPLAPTLCRGGGLTTSSANVILAGRSFSSTESKPKHFG